MTGLLSRALILLLVAVGSIVFILPFVWMVSTSFKSSDEVLRFPPVWIPSVIHLENYFEPWRRLPFALYYRNTLTVVGLNLIGTLLSSSIVAYGFARLRFRGRNIYFLILLSTMMLPGQVTLVPVYLMFKQLGWLNTFLPLIVPNWLGGGAFSIFLLRQFFSTLPLELDDAAKIDGCGLFTIYWRILLPLTKPALATVAIFAFFGNWNDFMGPLIFLSKNSLYTISLGLQFYVTAHGQVKWNLMMAATFLSVLPLLIVFFSAQRTFIQGVALTGIKG